MQDDDLEFTSFSMDDFTENDDDKEIDYELDDLIQAFNENEDIEHPNESDTINENENIFDESTLTSNNTESKVDNEASPGVTYFSNEEIAKQADISVKKGLTKIICTYIENNDYKSKNIIANHTKYITSEKELARNCGYRFWKFSDDRILDLIMGYSIRIEKSAILSYYAYVNRTATIFKALLDNNLLAIVEKGDKLANYYDVSGFLEKYGDEDSHKVLKRYKKEGELFRFDIGEYFLNISKNIKMVIIHNLIIENINIPKEITSYISDDYSAIILDEVKNLNILRSKIARLQLDKRRFIAEKLHYFDKRDEIVLKETKSIFKSQPLDVLTPGGNEIITINITD